MAGLEGHERGGRQGLPVQDGHGHREGSALKLSFRPGPGYFDEKYYGKVGEDPEQLDQRAGWVAKKFAPARALEIGCGRGKLLSLVRARGVDATGVDISRYAAGVHGKGFQVVGDDGALPFKDKSFDLVYGFDILEHNMEEFVDCIVAECARVCSANAFFNLAFEGMTSDVDDATHFTLKSRRWWVDKFKPFFEVVGDGGDCPGLFYRHAQMILRVRD